MHLLQSLGVSINCKKSSLASSKGVYILDLPYRVPSFLMPCSDYSNCGMYFALQSPDDGTCHSMSFGADGSNSECPSTCETQNEALISLVPSCYQLRTPKRTSGDSKEAVTFSFLMKMMEREGLKLSVLHSHNGKLGFGYI